MEKRRRSVIWVGKRCDTSGQFHRPLLQPASNENECFLSGSGWEHGFNDSGKEDAGLSRMLLESQHLKSLFSTSLLIFQRVQQRMFGDHGPLPSSSRQIYHIFFHFRPRPRWTLGHVKDNLVDEWKVCVCFSLSSVMRRANQIVK